MSGNGQDFAGLATVTHELKLGSGAELAFSVQNLTDRGVPLLELRLKTAHFFICSRRTEALPDRSLRE